MMIRSAFCGLYSYYKVMQWQLYFFLRKLMPKIFKLRPKTLWKKDDRATMIDYSLLAEASFPWYSRPPDTREKRPSLAEKSSLAPEKKQRLLVTIQLQKTSGLPSVEPWPQRYLTELWPVELQPVAKMLWHSHEKTTFLASNRSRSQVCET